MVGRKTAALLGVTFGLAAGAASGVYIERNRSDSVIEQAAVPTLPGSNGQELPTLTLPGAAGSVVTTTLVEVVPTPPAYYESGIVCIGPLVDDVLLDLEHAGIINDQGVNTISVLKGIAVARNNTVIRGVFDESHAEAFARDIARINGIDVTSPNFDPNNFPFPSPDRVDGYYVPTGCTYNDQTIL